MRKEKYIQNQNFKAKYESKNLVSKMLIDNFFVSVKNIGQDIKPDSILEIGCGHGYSTARLKNIYPDSIFMASDHEEQLINDAKIKNPNVSFTNESIYKLNHPENSISLIFALEVLEHLTQPTQALSELRRVCKNYCIISIPNEPLWRILNLCRGSYLTTLGNTPGHINHWNVNTFKKLVGQYFEIKKIYTPLPWIIVLAQKNKSSSIDNS